MKESDTLRTQYRVSDFLEWKRSNTLILNPNFQRRPVWKKGAKSYLIDTILRGLPMPIIFLRDLPTDLVTLKAKRDVVDGQQRIRTILSFIDSDLVRDDKFDPTRDIFTIDPTHNEDLGGQNWAKLSKENRQKILDYQFSVHVFSADTSDREILSIFARMNSTGVNLNAQELRNAEFFGPFKTAAYELATEQLNRWREWHVFTPDQIARMKEVELASEFMLLILDGVLEKNNAAINDYYDKYEDSFPDRTELSNRFRSIFDTLESLFEKDSPIAKLFGSRTLFYAMFVIVYGLQFELRSPLKPGERHVPLTRLKPKPLKLNELAEQLGIGGKRMLDRKTLPPRVIKALRGATTDASERRVIVGFLAGKDFDPCLRPLN